MRAAANTSVYAFSTHDSVDGPDDRNVALIERHMANADGTRSANRFVVLGAVVVLVLILSAGIAATTMLALFLLSKVR